MCEPKSIADESGCCIPLFRENQQLNNKKARHILRTYCSVRGRSLRMPDGKLPSQAALPLARLATRIFLIDYINTATTAYKFAVPVALFQCF